MRQPRSARRARARPQRWVLWAVLALLTLAPVLGCQAMSPTDPTPMAPAAVVTAPCVDGLGHDALCSRVAAVTVGASTRGGRDGEPDLLLSMAAAVALIGIGVDVAARARRIPRTPQRLVGGRQQLLALGIARI